MVATTTPMAMVRLTTTPAVARPTLLLMAMSTKSRELSSFSLEHGGKRERERDLLSLDRNGSEMVAARILAVSTVFHFCVLDLGIGGKG